MKYENLFSPGKIGSLTIRNRSVMAAMGALLCEPGGFVGERILAYFEERAKGGVGLIITGIMCFDEEYGLTAPVQISAARDDQIPGLQKLADTVHKHGAAIFGQLQHPGNVGNPKLNKRVISPSGIPSASGNPSEEMSVEEIQRLVRLQGEAALRLKKAGFDGVEIHAAHFYLVHQFLSPSFNHRDDAYGGDARRRFQFLKEIIQEIRRTCGDDFPLSVRVSVEEYMGVQGYHPDDGIQICKWLDEEGVDAIDITVSGSAGLGSHNIETIAYPQGWRRFLLKAVKRCVKAPTIGVCVIREAAFADELVASGDVDFIASGRNHLADAAWEKKIQEGCENEIRRCISCSRCIENVKMGKSISCSVNASCTHELDLIEQNGEGRSVIVLGAGPAGLEAARTAAMRGFSVSVYEKEAHSGGQVWLASQVPGKSKMSWLMEDAITAGKKLGVSYTYGKTLTVDEIRAMNPYAVIDATGGVPVVPASIPGSHKPLVCTTTDILNGSVKPEKESILVVGSGLTGLETAEYLLHLPGNNVMVAEMADTIAPGAYPNVKNDVIGPLNLANVIFLLGRKLLSIEDDRVFLQRVGSDDVLELPVDRVVLSLGVRPSGAYGEELASVCEKVFTVGDAETPARIMEAVAAGYQSALAL